MNDGTAYSVDPTTLAALRIDRVRWATLGLGLALFVPSTSVVQRYLGTLGTAGYLLVAAVALVLLVKRREAVGRWAARRSDRQILWLAGLTFGAIVVVFLMLYPVANSGRPDSGSGSDSDDALNVAVNELMHGRYPYYPTTYLDNPISPLPGAVLFAIPFVLLGSSAYQNIFWLLVFFMAMQAYLHGSRSVLLLLWVILLLSPIFWYALVTGSDYIANTLYVLLFSLWLIQVASRPRGGGFRAFLLAGLLGIGLSSRANFLFLLPLMFAALATGAGLKTAVKLTAIAGLSFIVVTVPFYLFDPRGFSPLHTTDELGRFDVVLPHAGLIIPLLTAALAIALAFFHAAWPDCVEASMPDRTRQSARTDDLAAAFLRNAALVLAFPVICGLVLYCVGLHRLYFGFATFGIFFLFFGAVPAWRTVFGSVIAEPSGIESAPEDPL